MSRDPKPKHFTVEQERLLDKGEKLLIRARIIERGVAAMLNGSEGYSAESDMCAKMLQEAMVFRADGHRMRQMLKADMPPLRRRPK